MAGESADFCRDFYHRRPDQRVEPVVPDLNSSLRFARRQLSAAIKKQAHSGAKPSLLLTWRLTDAEQGQALRDADD